MSLTYGKDRLGRTTAEAVTADGRIVNAEAVRSGLGIAVGDGGGSSIPRSIGVAAQEALANQRGMHAADIPCTVPGRVKALTDLIGTVPAAPPPGATLMELATYANLATDARASAEELRSAFAQNSQDITWLALDPGERADLAARVMVARDRAEANETALRDATSLAVNQSATLAAGSEEAGRIARKLAAIRRAEADRAAEAARRMAAARRAQADAAQARADAGHKNKTDPGRGKNGPEKGGGSAKGGGSDKGGGPDKGSGADKGGGADKGQGKKGG